MRVVKLHLVDATFELFRAYYSRPEEHGPDGRPVNAVRGLIESMLSLLRERDRRTSPRPPTTSSSRGATTSTRRYKSSVGMDPQLLTQFDDAERALRALGITTWAMVEDEADDAIAAGVARFGDDPRIEQVVICSVDKDLAQCVRGERVVLRDRMRTITYDEAGVIAKFGVEPESIPDYLALVGDSSDGYPGLPGWGSKSAAAVLAKFQHLEEIPASPLEWGVPLRNAVRLAATLQQQRADAFLYKRLATLNADAAISGDLDSLALGRACRATSSSALCDELGFDRIRERVHRWA